MWHGASPVRFSLRGISDGYVGACIGGASLATQDCAAGGFLTVTVAQAFTFITMDGPSSQRLQKALEEMNTSDFSDTTVKAGSLNVAFDTLRQSIRQLSGMLNSKRRTRP